VGITQFGDRRQSRPRSRRDYRNRGEAQLGRELGGRLDCRRCDHEPHHRQMSKGVASSSARARVLYAWRGSGVVHAVVTALVLATSRVPANASGAGPLAPSATRAGCASGDLRDRRRLRCKTCIRRPVFVLPRVCGASTVVVTAFVRRRQPGRPTRGAGSSLLLALVQWLSRWWRGDTMMRLQERHGDDFQRARRHD